MIKGRPYAVRTSKSIESVSKTQSSFCDIESAESELIVLKVRSVRTGNGTVKSSFKENAKCKVTNDNFSANKRPDTNLCLGVYSIVVPRLFDKGPVDTTPPVPSGVRVRY